MRLARAEAGGAFIPLTPLVDVMLILLVFFMVTSTYLDLRMIPAGGTADEPPPGATALPAPGMAAEVRTVLLRLDASGRAVLQGRAFAAEALEAELAARVAAAPGLRVLVLPSGLAPAQALVDVLQAAARAGVAETRIVRIEAAP